jgi:hypothetical protein
MSTQPNNATVVDTCTKRLNALKEYAGNKGTIPMNGADLKISDVIAIYQDCLDSRAALAKSRTQVKASLATKTNAQQARVSADMALSAWVTTKFGAGSQQALDFGFAPRKAATRTVVSKAKAAAQAKATREARHTMGKKQKSLIKGTVIAPTAPADPATNAPAGASPAGQPAALIAQASTPQQPAVVIAPATTPQSTQTQNGTSVPPAPASVTPASH